MSSACCIQVVTSGTGEDVRIHLPVHRGSKEQSRRVTSRVLTEGI